MGTIGIYPKFHGFDREGLPLEGGRLYSYLAGTSTPQAMYADAALTTPLPNPIVLDASGEALFYTNGQALKWVLRDQDDTLLWEIDPVSGGGAGATSGLVGLGTGVHTVVVHPDAGAVQASAMVFPPDVLALALTVWISETLGTSDGLERVGIGTPDRPDCWGYLAALSAATETTAGLFEGYSGQPQPQPGPITLTAYGGPFDGTGEVYLTGHFLTFHPGQKEGFSYQPGSLSGGLPLATTATPGIVELATTAETTTGTDATRAVTPAGLQAKWATLPGSVPATETQAGVLEVATQAEVDLGLDHSRTVTPRTLTARLTQLPVASTTQQGVVELATSAEALDPLQTSRAVTPAGLEAKFQTIPGVQPATETQAGILELATPAETTTGTDDARAVTPLKLAQRLAALPTASETAAGLVELATSSETTTGTDTTRAVTPAGLQAKWATLPGSVPATETQAGVLEVATQAEVSGGTDDARAVTPLKLTQHLTQVVPPATTTTPGLVELATSAETTTGTDATRAVTPAGLAAKLPSGTALSVTRYAASGTALEATPGLVTTASGSLGVGITPLAGQSLAVRGNTSQVRDDGSALSANLTIYSSSAGTTNTLAGYRARGTEALPEAVQAGDALLRLQGKGYGSSFPSAARTWIDFLAAELWTGTAQGSQMTFNTTLAGGTTQAARLTIDGQGNLTTWGGLCGLGTPLSATLGSGASYQALNVKGWQLFVGQSSVQERAMALLAAAWISSTDATRTGRLTLSAYDSAALREGVRVEADGTAGRLSFYGATAVVKPTVSGSRGGNAALGSVLTALSSLGLVTDSSTA